MRRNNIVLTKRLRNIQSTTVKYAIKGAVMQIGKALINDHLRVSKVS